MKKVSIRLPQNQIEICKACPVADTSWSRLVGLLRHEKLSQGEGLLIVPCSQVHTIFMKFSIDAIFLNSENIVLAAHTLKPWRVSPLYFGAKKVLELPQGSIQQFAIKKGAALEVNICSAS
jgi:uncharacterized membrane protein (UPF0127 family)